MLPKTLLAMSALIAVGLGACSRTGTGPEGSKNKPAQAANKRVAAVPAEIGTLAPTFNLASLDGKEIASNSLRGKVVLIDFWASWCGPCIESMPAIRKLQQEFAGKGLVVLAVSLDDNDAKLKDFLTRRSPGGIVVKPDAAFNQDYGTLLHLKGDRLVTPDKLIQANLPTWILIDRKGRVAAIHKSSAEEDQVLSEASALATSA